jgi:hypothetical protein
MKEAPNNRMYANRRPALQFSCSRLLGRWIRSRCPFPAAVGDPCHSINMKTHLVALLLLSLCSLSSLRAHEDFDTKEPRWKQLSQAYGFVLGQQTSLELVERKFPTLAKDAKEAWFAFNSTALGESVKGVEDELARELGAKWPEYKEQMATQIHDLLGKQDLTLQQATEFLAEVRRRAKGDMLETIRSALLSAHPRYSKNPALELSDEWKQTFRTKDHPKAKGVDFSISVPASWRKREGNRPNIIQVFRSGSGHGPIMCNLMVKAIPRPAGYTPTKQELKEFFQPDELKGMVPDGGKFVTAQELVLEGAPAGMIVCDITQQRLDLTITMRMTQFVTIHKNSLIFIQFMVSKLPDTEETLDQLQQQFLPTFKSVANTFVLNDRYK